MSNILSSGIGSRKLWMITAILLFLLLSLMLAGYSPWGARYDQGPTIVEKEKIVDNPELLMRISFLEDENEQISGLKTKIVDLSKSTGLLVGLKAKIAALEALDINFSNTQNDSKLLQKINNLEVKTLTIPSLESRIKALQANKSVLTKRIAELEKENALTPGLRAKVKALEAIDINFVKPKDDAVLIKRVGDLEAENSMISDLKAKVKALEAINLNVTGDASRSSVATMVIPKVAKLYFARGVSRFPIDLGQSMADVVVYLRAHTDSNVSVVGFHDDSGQAEWNQRLSAKRSSYVRQILLGAGVADSRIKVKIPDQTLGSGSPEEARRVEVEVLN